MWLLFLQALDDCGLHGLARFLRRTDSLMMWAAVAFAVVLVASALIWAATQ
jgi:hypothetical protein